MRKVKLSDVCDISSGGTPSRNNPEYFNGDIPWAKISDIENADNGLVYETEEHISTEGLKNIRGKLFPKGTLLFAMYGSIGKIGITGREMSTNQAILGIRPRRVDEINLDYLKIWFVSNKQKLINQGRGVALKNLSATIVRDIEIELPHLNDQVRIAHLFGKVEELITQRKQHLQQLDDLLKSVFLEMFGDPVRNEKGWVKTPLEKLGSVNRGVSKHRPRNDPKLLGGKYPLIQTGEVSNAGTYITTYTQTYSDIGFAQSKQWPVGTLCITIAANIAQTGIVTFEACFPDSVVGFIANKNEANPLYVHGLFWFFQSILEKNAPAAAQKNINLEILRGLEVPKPPVEFQNQFATIVEKVEGIKSRYKQSLNDLEALYGALSQRAFRGELDLSRVTLSRQADETPDLTKQANMEPTTPASFQLPEPETLDWLTVENRQKLFKFWLNAWCKRYAEESLTASKFLDAASQRLVELSERDSFQFDQLGKGFDEVKWYEEPSPFGINEYEQVKKWVFEALASGKLRQGFDDADNSVTLANRSPDWGTW